MSVVQEVKTSDGDHYGWAVQCPGCQSAHFYDQRWTFNGDMEKPTFLPSLNIKIEPTDRQRPNKVCHSNVTDGRIMFHNDCTHILAGESRMLLDFDKDEP